MGNKNQQTRKEKIPLYMIRANELIKEENKKAEVQKALKSQKYKKNYGIVSFENQVDTSIKAIKKGELTIADSFQGVRKVFLKLQDKKCKFINFAHLKELLVHLFKNNCTDILEKEQYAIVLFNLFVTSQSWIRPIGEWKRNSHNPEKQIASLLRHLFAKYETPAFLDSMWYEESTLKTYLFAYIDIAQGKNVRQCSGFPVVMSKRMAHEFMQTPAHYTIKEAIRRAQVLSLGGDENLAYYVCRSRLGNNSFYEDDFWFSVIRFFAQQELFDNRHVPEMIDYIYFMRFEDRRLVDGRMLRGNPNYSMKGRTAIKLLEQSQAWHRNAGYQPKVDYEWDKIGFSEKDWVEGEEDKQKIYFITELNSSRLLREEGKEMRHCVYSYARQCAAKQSAIFSLRLFKGEFNPLERLATIEVNLRDLRVVQIRGKCNAKVNNQAVRFITDWATENRLTISNYAW
jgi:hypothetical protein